MWMRSLADPELYNPTTIERHISMYVNTCQNVLRYALPLDDLAMYDQGCGPSCNIHVDQKTVFNPIHISDTTYSNIPLIINSICTTLCYNTKNKEDRTHAQDFKTVCESLWLLVYKQWYDTSETEQ